MHRKYVTVDETLLPMTNTNQAKWLAITERNDGIKSSSLETSEQIKS